MGKKSNPYRKTGISGLNEIFETYPELQNATSSMWYFFLLFPKQGEAYGPKQLMFTFASKMGKQYAVNGLWQKGMQKRKYVDDIRNFMTTAVGWVFDGEAVHEDVIHQPVEATISKDGWLKAWTQNNIGGEIVVEDHSPPRMQVKFHGKRGSADFTVWSEDDWIMSTPNNQDLYNSFYNSLLVSWRKFSFLGSFAYDDKKEELEGYGYFQRVCLNLPMMPWFWPIIMFPDGSMFSSFQPYFGINNFKKLNRVVKNSLKKIRLNVGSTAYYADYQTKEIIEFENSYVHTIRDDNDDVVFEIVSKNKNGDFIKFKAQSLANTGFNLEKYMGGIFHSLHNYNEYIIHVTDFHGKINGEKMKFNSDDKIFGNIEYCWGMSI